MPTLDALKIFDPRNDIAGRHWSCAHCRIRPSRPTSVKRRSVQLQQLIGRSQGFNHKAGE